MGALDGEQMSDALGRIDGLPKPKPRHEPGPVRAWMADHRKALLPRLGRPGAQRPADWWDGVAAAIEDELAAAGKVGPQGERIRVTGILARKTWWRVCHPRGVAPKRKPKEAPAVRKAPKGQPKAPPPPAVTILRPAAPMAPVPPTETAPGSADEAIQRLKATLAGRGHQLPRIVE